MIEAKKKILDVGCGRNKMPGAIGLDSNPRTDADVIHDLGDIPYPFADSEFDEVVANHVAEHVPDLMAFISELYRITRHGGVIKVLAPHYSNPDWPSDPTHRNHLNSYTFNCFIRDPKRRLFPFYTEIELELRRVHVSLANLWRAIGLELIVNLDERWPSMRFTRKFWEHYLSFICRGKELYFEFEVIKEEKKEDTREDTKMN